MSDTPETLAAILADFRKFALRAAEEDRMISPESVLLLADKVEAAAERERAHEIELAKLRAPGNAAAMQRALNSISDIAEDAFGGPERYREASQGRALSLIVDTARAALAAPARNCDVGTAAEQKARHDRFCSRHYKAECVDSQCFGCPAHDEKTETDCEFVWAQMPFAPAEGGAK